MPPSLWEKWVEHWAVAENVSKSKIAKKNRCGGEGGIAKATHGGGSVSFQQHIHKEKQKRPGEDIHVLEEIIKYNGKKSRDGSLQKDENGNPIFANKQLTEALEQYKVDVQPVSEEGERVDGVVAVDVTSIPFQGDKWIESVGGVKKGRVLGVGTARTFLAVTGSSASSVSSKAAPSISPEAQMMIDEAHRAAEEARKGYEEMRERLNAMEEFMRSKLGS